jgi:cytidyltransferase-like protein
MPARKRMYKTVALGGTFDVFHKGHERFLSAAFKLSQRVIIGITSDQLVKTLGKSHPVEPYSTRVQNVRQFLSIHKWTKRGEIHRLDDPFGPAVIRKSLGAVIVTPDTLSSGRELNDARREDGLNELQIQIVPFTLARDGRPISSTRVRKGEIDGRGKILHPC